MTHAQVRARCAVPGCGFSRDGNGLMCAVHWVQVPLAERRAVWQLHQRAQEYGGEPTAEYQEAARKAIEAVTAKAAETV